MIAAIRPDDWNLPLFLHVLGAMLALGALVLALVYLAGALRTRSPESLRAAFRALLLGALPGYLLMRVFAQVIYSKEGLDDLPTDPTWVGIGFIAGDMGLLFLVIALVASGRGSRASATTGGQTGTVSVRLTTALTVLLAIAYIVSV